MPCAMGSQQGKLLESGDREDDKFKAFLRLPHEIAFHEAPAPPVIEGRIPFGMDPVFAVAEQPQDFGTLQN